MNERSPTPTPVQLPLTREQALEIAANWWRCPGEGVEVLLRDLGLDYAEPAPAPLPEPRWPAKLVVKRRECARLLIAVDDERYGLEDWYFALSTPGHLDEAAVAEEVAHRWSRCAELEAEAATLRQQAEALLASLEERTRERDAARNEAELRKAERDVARSHQNEDRRDRDEWRRKWGEAHSFRRLAEDDARQAWDAARRSGQSRAEALTERDAARQEAAELRRRCEWATREANAILAQRSIVSDAMTVNAWFLGLVHQVLPVLRGQRPVPGSEGGSGA